MSTNDFNPYQASAIDPKPPAGPRGAMEYMRAVQYVFESPKWVMNLVWGSLCILSTSIIPIVGQLLWIGYQFEVVEELLCRPPVKGYPDFDLNRLKEYLMRGLWIFLVTLVLMLVIMPVMLIVVVAVGATVAGLAAATDGDDGDMAVGMIVMFALLFLVALAFSLVMNIVMTPLLIRAGLTQDFRDSFDFAWIKDFVRQMWFETLLAGFFLMAVAMLASIVGLLACLVGLYPAMAAMTLVQGHLYLQLYQLYLTRGGQPIVLKTATL